MIADCEKHVGADASSAPHYVKRRSRATMPKGFALPRTRRPGYVTKEQRTD
jgi:hypothetical protein